MNGISPADKEDATGGAPDGNSPQPSQTDGNSQLKSTGIPLAVEIGWTMAVLYSVVGPQPDNRWPSVTDRLPTEHELLPAERKALEQDRVNALLGRLKGLLPAGADKVSEIRLNGGDGEQTGAAATALNADQKSLTAANLNILEWLACAGRDFGIAYQLGRSLRDTANPPLRRDAARLVQGTQEIQARSQEAAKQPRGNLTAEKAEKQATLEFEVRDALVRQLSRSRVATLQEWLSTLEPYLPGDSAAIVSVSIGRWGDLVSTIFDKNTPGGLRRFRGQSQLYVAGELAHSLLPQGDAWLDLLIGAASSQELTPEGYVAAGEAALGRTARIVKRIAAHYWFLLAILAVALGGALYFAASGIGGAGRAWTQIAAVASALGVSYKGIASAAARLSAEAEKNIYDLEKIDALAWSVTTFPAELKLNGPGVRALRRSGILPPGPMGGT